jgi:hypothetical protein
MGRAQPRHLARPLVAGSKRWAIPEAYSKARSVGAIWFPTLEIALRGVK